MTAKQTRTQWFEPTDKPIYVGVYEMEGLPFPYHYWNGRHWGSGAGDTPDDPELKSKGVNKDEWSYVTRKRWRGLANKV